jgi:hypothetical protein
MVELEEAPSFTLAQHRFAALGKSAPPAASVIRGAQMPGDILVTINRSQSNAKLPCEILVVIAKQRKTRQVLVQLVERVAR